MKKVLTIFAIVGLFAFSAFGGPFVGFELTIPATAELTFGVIDDGLTLALVVDDVFVAPTLGAEATFASTFSWWDSEFTLTIDNVDVVTNYPIPVVDGINASWLGTLHLGDLLVSDKLGAIAPYTFDIYGGVDFAYDGEEHTLTPTGKIGFYWEL